MIYVINHQFTVGSQIEHKKTASVTEQLAMSKMRAPKEHKCPLTQNHTYIVNLIKPNIKDHTINYHFQDTSDKRVTIVNFDSTGEADEFIARVSGCTEKLKEVRSAIKNSLAEL